jgi:carbohydrate kinase (thermoresistant glucokinase family)
MGQAIIIMGVCGTGKTTVGEVLAARLGCPFLEGDSFHPPENVEKMRAGTPLNDEDRWPWLRDLGKAIAYKGENAASVVATCSALKRAYRDVLRDQAGATTLFVLLHGSRDLLMQRLQERNHLYMPSSLLDSQLETLEPPETDEMSLSLNVEAALPVLVQRIEREVSKHDLGR